jgi:hypothetical protein
MRCASSAFGRVTRQKFNNLKTKTMKMKTSELSSRQMKEVKGGWGYDKPRMSVDDGGVGHCATPWGEIVQPCTSDAFCKEILGDDRAECI